MTYSGGRDLASVAGAAPARRAVDDELTDTSTSPLTEGVTTHPGDDGFPT